MRASGRFSLNLIMIYQKDGEMLNEIIQVMPLIIIIMVISMVIGGIAYLTGCADW